MTISGATSVLNTLNGDIWITAWDVDFEGGIQSGTKGIHLHGSQAAQTLGMGTYSTGNMKITSSELQQVSSAGGFTIGGDTGGNIEIVGMEERGSNHVTGVLSLIGRSDDATATFIGLVSTFNNLAVATDSGVKVEFSLNVDATDTFLNGDLESSSA